MITLFLLGKKGLETLLKLESTNLLCISKVIIGTDKNVVEDYSKELISFCSQNEIKYSVSSKENTFSSEYAIAIGWRKLIDYNSNQRLIVFHDSILPRLRGFNPLVTALINGDEEVGVTALFASQDYDRGDIIDVKKTSINYPVKIENVIEILADSYAVLCNKIVNKIKNKELITTHKQDESLATYSLWRDEEDYFIDWSESSDKIARQIDAVGFPYKGAKTNMGNQIITITESEPIMDVLIENRSIGKVIFKQNNNPVIVCGNGLLLVKSALDSNNQKVDFSNFFRLRFK
jgi:methionyl-tRNA formyltransferase